jgi:hypothetical protein
MNFKYLKTQANLGAQEIGGQPEGGQGGGVRIADTRRPAAVAFG